MEVRLANIIGTALGIFFESGVRLRLGLFPIDTSIEEMKKEYKIKNFEKIYGEIYSFSEKAVWDTKSGKLEPGCMYWNDSLPENFYWDNHTGSMLHVVLPNGHHWNIDSRASNCTMKEDRLHRCWVRQGTPPNVTVGKGGNTCSAGAGSIQMENYHGYLRNGKLVKA